MKNIITALNNPELNNELKKEKNLKIKNKDIIYKEGILEILQKDIEINLIIINFELPGKITIEKLIEEIKKLNNKIELIFILEKENKEKEKILRKYEIKKIYYNNKINKKKLIEIINKEDKEKELEDEIKRLKKIIEENKKIKNNKKNNFKKFKKLKLKKTENKSDKNKIIKNTILIHENLEIGRSRLIINIINLLNKKNKKILIIDLKINKEDIYLLLNKKNIPKLINNNIKKINLKIQNENKKYKIEKILEKIFLFKINNNINLITNLNKIKEIKFKQNNIENKIIYLIEKNSKKYDYIIIEISDENDFLNQKLYQKIEKNIIIFFNDLNNIKKIKEKTEKLNNKETFLFLNNKKIKTKEKIDIKLIKEIFKNQKIIKNNIKSII